MPTKIKSVKFISGRPPDSPEEGKVYIWIEVDEYPGILGVWQEVLVKVQVGGKKYDWSLIALSQNRGLHRCTGFPIDGLFPMLRGLIAIDGED